jgi:hypothetical protein
MSSARRRAYFELLESRVPLTAAHPVGPGADGILIALRAAQQPPVLMGTLHGTYAIGDASPQATRSAQLTGSGKIQELGRVRVAGSVQETGVTEPGQGIGMLILMNARGRLVLRLEAQAQASGSALDQNLAFVVQGGTGTFRQLTGAGSIALDFGAPSPTSAHHGTTVGPTPAARGSFTLLIQPAPAVPGVGTGQPPPPLIASGIRGTAVEGPIAPVARPGQPDTQPLPDAIISVQPAGGGPELTRQQADAMGNFAIALAPGSYRIVPLPPQPGQFFPRGIPQDITIAPNQIVDLVVNYDTGIR